jgi:hypothetical protein
VKEQGTKHREFKHMSVMDRSKPRTVKVKKNKLSGLELLDAISNPKIEGLD